MGIPVEQEMDTALRVGLRLIASGGALCWDEHVGKFPADNGYRAIQERSVIMFGDGPASTPLWTEGH